MPGIGLEVAPRDAAAGAGEGVVVIADRAIQVKYVVEIEVRKGRVRRQVPAELLVRVAGVVLAVAAAVEVADDAAPPVLREARIGPPQAHLRLARARGPRHDGQRAGDQAASEMSIEEGDSKA